MIVFTSICANYLSKAKVLAKSVKQHITDAKVIVCLVENEIHPFALTVPEFDEIFLAKDIGFTNFNRFIFRHSLVEASTSVKAQIFKHLLSRFPDEDKFMYLDPDIVIYSDFVELRKILDEKHIVVCPHLLEPGNVDMEFSSLQHGAYNLGFLAVSRSEEATRFLDWWADRLFWYCYDDMPKGIFTDQKWIDLAPSFFDVHILKHKGYDFATWSLLNAVVTEREGKYFIKDDELRFAHFSGYDSKTVDWAIQAWLPEKGTNPFIKLYRNYIKALEENEQKQIGEIPWSYGTYNSGEKVSKRARLIVRREHDIQFSIENPFEYSNLYFELVNLKLLAKKFIRKIIK